MRVFRIGIDADFLRQLEQRPRAVIERLRLIRLLCRGKLHSPEAVREFPHTLRSMKQITVLMEVIVKAAAVLHLKEVLDRIQDFCHGSSASFHLCQKTPIIFVQFSEKNRLRFRRFAWYNRSVPAEIISRSVPACRVRSAALHWSERSRPRSWNPAWRS